MLNVGLTWMLCRMEFPSIAIDAMRAELVCVPGGILEAHHERGRRQRREA
jgi:hypothetical protein